MELKLYLQMLQRGWWLVVLSALAGLVGSLSMSYLETPIFRATSRFVVSPDATVSKGTDVINSLNVLDKRSIVTTYAEVLNSNTIYTQAISDLHLTSEAVDGYLHSTVVLPESNVLEVSIEGPNPQIVAFLANSVGEQAIQYIDGLNQGYSIRLLDQAQIPTEPIRPQPARDASLGLLLGLIFGASVAIIREQLLVPIEAYLRRHNVDPDSGVFSRQRFNQLLDETLARSAFVGFHALGLVHLEGLVGYIGNLPKPLEQQMLRQIAKILSSELRGNDLVGRWDGSTFAVLLPGTPGRAAVVTLGRVQSMLSVPLVLNDTEMINLKPRIGLSERLDNEPSSSLRDHAELALKQSIDRNLNLILFESEVISSDNGNGAHRSNHL